MVIIESQRTISDHDRNVVEIEDTRIHDRWEIAHLRQESEPDRRTEIAVRKEFGSAHVFEVFDPAINENGSESIPVQVRDIFIVPSSDHADVIGVFPGNPADEVARKRDGKYNHVQDDAVRVFPILRVPSGTILEVTSHNGHITTDTVKIR